MKKYLKKGLIAALIFLVILFIVFGTQIIMGNSAVDIQLHDTYLVFGYTSFWLVVLLATLFVFSLTVCLATRFRKKSFMSLLIASTLGLLALVAVVAWGI
jgi:hypothetical protein